MLISGPVHQQDAVAYLSRGKVVVPGTMLKLTKGKSLFNKKKTGGATSLLSDEGANTNPTSH